MSHVAIIAALEREVQALAAKHCPEVTNLPGTSLRWYATNELSIVCGGIGADAARKATLALIQARRPDLLVSVGVAGALIPGLRVGEVVEPTKVMAIASGKTYATLNRHGAGLLISADRVADFPYKAELSVRYNGTAVDMEAATVAEVAAENSIGFAAIKAVSDEVNVTLPDVSAFIDLQGNFRQADFVKHLALRPWLWPGIAHLARSSAKAIKALQMRISEHITNGGFERMMDDN